jgi:hypothetical protein
MGRGGKNMGVKSLFITNSKFFQSLKYVIQFFCRLAIYPAPPACLRHAGEGGFNLVQGAFQKKA